MDWEQIFWAFGAFGWVMMALDCERWWSKVGCLAVAAFLLFG